MSCFDTAVIVALHYMVVCTGSRTPPGTTDNWHVLNMYY